MTVNKLITSAFFLIIFSLCISTGNRALAAQTDEINEPRELDIEAIINPKLDVYHFHLKADQHKDTYQQELQHVGIIKIDTPKGKKQQIEVFADAPISLFIGSFNLVDINFDGYLDISYINSFGAKWHSSTYLLFDKKTGKFIANKLTRQLNRIEGNAIYINPNTSEIYAENMGPSIPGLTVNKIIDNQLVVTKAIDAEVMNNNGQVEITFTIRKRIGDQLVIEREWKEFDSLEYDEELYEIQDLIKRFNINFD